MKSSLTMLLCLMPGAALAHVGHLGDLAGHDHVVAGIALGAAVGAAIWGWLAGGPDRADEEATPEAEEPQA